MGQFTASIEVNKNNEALFRYLSDPNHLTDYIPWLTSAEPGTGDEIKTTANLPDGRVVSADAWFRVNEDARRIEWGSEGGTRYSGYLHVTGSGNRSQVELHLNTAHAADGNTEVQSGIEETLNNLKRLIEQRVAAS